MINLSSITINRPKSSYSPTYARCKKEIKKYRAKPENKAHFQIYMRNYMAKRRLEPDFRQDTCDRPAIRYYLLGRTKYSPSAVNKLGCTRQQFAQMLNMTEEAFSEWIKGKAMDHIVPYSWFEKHPELKPLRNRWYNVRWVTGRRNGRKGAWVDETLPVIQWVIAKMEMERFNLLTEAERANAARNLSRKIKNLEKQLEVQHIAA
jgi:hypothetical protein